MTEETKFLITELNKLLSRNYNVSSFENLTKDDLLQVVYDVLVALKATPSSSQQQPTENIIVTILEALHNIKYSPSTDVSPEEFRDGIALGNRLIIRPILYWLLSNPQQVKKRAYLSKYVEKVECPPEMLDDMDVRLMRTQYESLIEEFWKTYTENRKTKKNASEVNELQQDIVKMEEDTVRLQQRMEQQKEKMENVPNKEVLLTIVKAYRNEVNEQRKLEEQLAEQKDLETQMENEIKDLKTKLAYKQGRHPTKLEPLQQIMDELRTNKILLSQIPEELNLAKKEIDMYETVVNGSEPSEIQLNELNNELAKVNSEIQKLVENKMAQNTDGDAQLGPFRNQATIIANKKQEVSNAVKELKNQISSVDTDISEKEDTLMALVGGPVLQGDNLRKYVAKLREHNIVYKEYKLQLRSLTTELGILTRTQDVLKLMDPAVEEALKNENNAEKDAEEIPKDTDALKQKLKTMAAEIDKQRAETAQVREELRTYINEAQPLINEHKRIKQHYDDIAGPEAKQLEEIKTEVTALEEQIKTQEEKWKSLRQETERKDELLVRLNEDVVNTTNEITSQPTQIEILKQKIEQQEKANKNLQEEISRLEKQKVKEKENVAVLESIINLLKAKQQCKSN